MKKLLLTVVAASILSGCSVPADLQGGAPMQPVSKVVEFQGMKKDAIFNNSKIWVAKSFTSANDVIQYADKEQGSIVGKGTMDYPCEGFNDCLANAGATVKFTMKIDSKDDKARVTFSDFGFHRPASVSGGIVIPAEDYPVNQQRKINAIKPKLEKFIQEYSSQVKSQTVSDSSW
ncbi:TPA: DUF4468 domain-containing protein [Enterobacter cloacae]